MPISTSTLLVCLHVFKTSGLVNMPTAIKCLAAGCNSQDLPQSLEPANPQASIFHFMELSIKVSRTRLAKSMPQIKIVQTMQTSPQKDK
ncbi:hypothetical protein B0H13DRAFT_2035753 [Mycena leptocephala]|nr:hypothetical protein B0H13DRAFT_2035753 [Mycena leptocephala]